MPIVKQQRHENEIAVHTLRNEPGLQALRAWAHDMRDEINARWMHASGDELISQQGKAKLLQMIIKMIDDGPAIRGDA